MATIASDTTSREGLTDSVIQHAMIGMTSASRPGVIRRGGQTGGRRRGDKRDERGAFVRGQRQEKRQRHEERDGHVRQNEMRFADVQGHHGQERRGQERRA